MCLFANEKDEEIKKKEIKATWDDSNSDSSDEDSSDQEVVQENVVNSKPTYIIETHHNHVFQQQKLVQSLPHSLVQLLGHLNPHRMSHFWNHPKWP